MTTTQQPLTLDALTRLQALAMETPRPGLFLDLLATLNELHAHAAEMPWEAIDAVEASVRALPVEEAVALARGFSRRTVTSRTSAARRIRERLAERLGRHERGEEIGRLARG
jgi:hypothetical protein